jgi:bis(5'-nucleosyl)-tetraphosphatase (symmetrical)
MRIFVGDIQGCADELDDLLELLNFDTAAHELFCVGDLVNRGPFALRTLRRLRKLGAQSVLGNHDLHLLAVAAGERNLRETDTLDDVLAAPDREELLQWLRERPLLIEWPELVLVHAGLSPLWSDYAAIARPLEASIRTGRIPWQSDELGFMTRVRLCDAQGQRSNELEANDRFRPWDEFYRGERIVVCGHWASRGLVQSERLRALDSGCVWGGRLSAWIAEEDRIVSVPARKSYAPIDS